MRVTFGRRAQQQIARIVEHVAQDNPRAAADIAERIEAAAASLADFPERGQVSSRVAGLRWLAVSNLPYLMFYTILRNGTVRIVRVLHGARDLPRAFGS